MFELLFGLDKVPNICEIVAVIVLVRYMEFTRHGPL